MVKNAKKRTQDDKNFLWTIRKDQALDLQKDWALTVVVGGPKIKEVFNCVSGNVVYHRSHSNFFLSHHQRM
jgi:hypothetical protein